MSSEDGFVEPIDVGGISVTIKTDEPGGKFNDAKSPGTWLVFHGTPARVRKQICEVFGLELDPAQPLYLVVLQAEALFKGAGKVHHDLGGRVISPPASGQSQPAGQPSGDVWSQASQSTAAPAQAAPEEPPVDPIIAALDACTTVAEVQQVWAENQAAFAANAAYMDAYKARGKALSK